MKKSKYKEYLKSEHWKNLKLRYVESDLFDNKCRLCERPLKKPYHFHHRSYRRLWKERLTDIIPACAKCHRHLHKVLFDSDTLNTWTAVDYIRKKRKLKGLRQKRKKPNKVIILTGYKTKNINGKARRIPNYEKRAVK